MKFSVTYPLITHPASPELMTREAITRFAQTAEAAGFDGIGFTDHPAPTDKWLNAGGHDALDPFVALTFCAAVTERIRLIPNIVVLPYRHPLIVAKMVATMDILSDDRFTLAVATGYLRGEYRGSGNRLRSSATPCSTRPSTSCVGCGRRTTSRSRASASTPRG